jgi:DNA-binding beta-propeller fold protein YncE
MRRALTICAGWILVAPLTALIPHSEQTLSPMKQIATIRLPNVSGRIDHLAFDVARQRFFIAALGNNSVEVLDLATGEHLQSLKGFQEPQGVAAVADLDAIAVANGGPGTLQLIDAKTLATRWTIHIGDDADNVRYDAAARRLYVAAVGGLFAIDPVAGRTMGRISIDGHPESFQLETTGTRVFANLPGLLSSSIIGGDRKQTVADARWPTPNCGGNYPMALDEATSRLLVGCRRPARMAVVDSRSGKFLSSVEIVEDTDDLFYDAARQRAYVIGGEGFCGCVGTRG